ncbi:hypothetical protein MtrunA17_Chr3g0102591 [Medicago truncatula]|uniref:Uncharacterized protein n=1 Tax=Medicago truncatula TaxID=3880 RepID=A0A396ITY4_MEDTR|nr:hypothetical protein MtrunA17_Chr3g0102591 [Medicago truncatula]
MLSFKNAPVLAQAILAVLPPWIQHNQQQDPAIVNGGGENQHGGGQGKGLMHIMANIIIQIEPVLALAILAVLPPQHQQQQVAGNLQVPAMVNGGGGAYLDEFEMANDHFKHMWYARGLDGALGPDPNVFRDLGLIGDGFDAVFAVALANYNLVHVIGGMRKG